MKVIFAIPTHSGLLESECVLSLLTIQTVLIKKGIEHDVFILTNCPYLPMARNTLVAMFMDTDATDLFFIDSDVAFDAKGAWKILERKEGIVAGIYPLKRDPEEYPVKIKTRDGVPIGQEGLIEAELLPTGFMRIKREVFNDMKKAYPELKYTLNHVNVDVDIKEAYDFFTMGIEEGTRWTTEDYAFCNKWTKIGGQLWIEPDIDFHHVGKKKYKGNLHEFLIGQKIKNMGKVINGG